MSGLYGGYPSLHLIILRDKIGSEVAPTVRIPFRGNLPVLRAHMDIRDERLSLSSLDTIVLLLGRISTLRKTQQETYL